MQTRIYSSYQAIEAAAWNRLAGSQPCLQHTFLAGLEHCGCTTPATGWTPEILTLWQDETLIAALPQYAKTHSMGEFVFDWAWADAYARHGLAYYPKLTVAAPFSPLEGPRLLATGPTQQATLLAAAMAHASEHAYSSLHILFPAASERPLLESHGLLLRQGVQFHWHNPGYRDFEDFLAALTRDKRKKIRQERRRVADAGITLRRLTGAAISPDDMDFAYTCYANTYHVRGRHPYLTRAFFQHLLATQADQLLLVLACRNEGTQMRPVAMALNLFAGDTLWGRYWGCTEQIACLHFETCYYQAIEFCIERGIRLFEGGAQGEHKLARGFSPVTTWSAHWVANPEFRAAIAHFLERESRGIAEYLDELDEHTPFRAAP